MNQRTSPRYVYSTKGYRNPADIPEKQLRTMAATVSSFAALCRAFNVAETAPGRNDLIARVRALGIDTSHFRAKLHAENNGSAALQLKDILKLHHKRVPIAAWQLIERLIKEGIFQNQCSDCGQTHEWQGRPLSMKLGHINGDSRDLTLENLRPLCPNCYSQLEDRAINNARAAAARKRVREKALIKNVLLEEGGVAESG